MVEIEKELELLRQNLLDLSYRNNLINYKPSKGRTIPIIDEYPREIYNIFVLQEKSMKFLPKDIDSPENLKSDSEKVNNSDLKWAPIINEAEEPDHYFDDYLNTPYGPEDLGKKLFYVYNQAKSVFEEQGYPVLYLALGFLKWTEDKNSLKVCKAPLILVPVELERSGVSRKFILKWTGDDIFTSITLQAKLAEQGVELPEFEMPDEKSGIDLYFQSVLNAISDKKDWSVLSEIYLDFFNFKKFVMYRDLDLETWPENLSPTNHSLIQKIFNPSEDSVNQQSFSEKDVDLKLSAKNTYHILDADSSQIAAIEDVKTGINLVVEGPPGTGKSQTITNIIAELLKQGKSVLFVSEKMAALEVVKSRLDNTGLGDLCLELHSRKAKKKEVLAELERTLNRPAPKSINFDHEINNLDQMKSELNEYVTVLNQSVGKLNFSLYEMYGLKEKVRRYFMKNNRPMLRVEFSDPDKWDYEQWTEAISTLEKLTELLPIIKTVLNNPWKSCEPEDILPSDLEEIDSCIDDYYTSITDLEHLIKNLADLTGGYIPLSEDKLIPFVDAAKVVASSYQVDEEVLRNPKWDSQNKEAEGLISKLKRDHDLDSFVKESFNASVLEIDVYSLLNEFKYLVEKKSETSDFYISQVSHEESDIVSDLECIREWKQIKNYIESKQVSGLQIFGNLWNGEKTDIRKLEEFSKWMDSFKKQLVVEKLSVKASIILNNGISKDLLQNSKWEEVSNETEAFRSKLKKYKELNSLVQKKFENSIIDKDIVSFKSSSAGLLKFLKPGYRKLKSEILGCYKSQPPSNDAKILQDLQYVFELKLVLEDFRNIQSRGQDLFGTSWQNELTDADILGEFVKLISLFKKQFSQGVLSQNMVELLRAGIDQNVLNNYEWDSPNNEVEAIISRLRRYHYLNSYLENTFNDSIFEQDTNGLIRQIKMLYEKKQEVSGFYKTGLVSNDEGIISDLKLVFEFETNRKELTNMQNRGWILFGTYWENEKADPQILEDFSKWITYFRKYVVQGILSEKSIEIVSKGVKKDDLNSIISSTIKKIDNLKTQNNSLFKLLNTEVVTIFGKNIEGVPFDELKNKLELWKSELSSLISWSQFVNYRKQCLNTVAAPFIHIIDNDEILADDLVPGFKGNYADNLLKITFREKKILPAFVKELQDNKIKKFKELDSKIILLNRQSIAHEAYSNKPNVCSGASRGSEAGFLLNEFNRKRGHMPIRKLMTLSGGLIQKIKPCFMMSPLSIAQYLDPRTTKFDVIVFDEASQVKPEDAIGALLRGNQVVVMGDSRQLPPTSFFDHVADTSDTDLDDDAIYSDMESILNVCKRSFPSKTLRWHYRSRHETLIAVSNQEFYDNRLYVYPSPMHDDDKLGLKFVYLPDTIYDRGGSSGNRGEARTVAKAVLEHYKHFPSKSIGVGTFNAKQQEAIQEEIEELLRHDPGMEKCFTNEKGENFFVKNIETIQGDERDIIFISIGFGFDINHKLNKNFGPLNKEGGERRLNVLITRAREKCIVYSNFTSRDLRIDEKDPFGLRALKIFLEYAETKNLVAIEGVKEDTESPFEDSVYEFLRDNGYEVHKQVGCAGYRIDLAIIDSSNPGHYFIGIECDGATYHSSPVARDRDRLRQQILEGLGWSLYRIWSTDWYRHPMESGYKLLETIENAKKCLIINEKEERSIYESSTFEIEYDEKVVLNNQFTSQVESLDNLEEKVQEYKIYPLAGVSTSDFSDISISQLKQLIIDIVEYEGPIHSDELIQRIKLHFGIARIGGNMKSRICSVIKYAEESKQILVKNDFLGPNSEHKSILRRRCGDKSVKIEWICDEEIIQAICFVLTNQYSTAQEDLIVQTSRVLGIKVVRQNAKNRIENIIGSLIREDYLVKLPNEMIYFRETGKCSLL